MINSKITKVCVLQIFDQCNFDLLLLTIHIEQDKSIVDFITEQVKFEKQETKTFPVSGYKV